MPVGQRPKPPAETKAALMEQIVPLLQKRHSDPEVAVRYLLNFFTSIDLVEIRNELRRT